MTHTHPESFDDSAATWDDEVKTARARSVAATIVDTVSPAPTARLLEYGAGTGLAAQFLAPHVGAITLADPSSGMRAVAHDKIASGVLPAGTRVWDVNLDHEDAPAESFDLIVTVLALHHVTDPSAVLTRLGAMLADGGALCVVDLEAEDGSFHEHSDDVAHGFDEDALSAHLASAGMSAVYHRGIYELEKNDQLYPLFLAVCSHAPARSHTKPAE